MGLGVEYTDLQTLNTINGFANASAPAVGSSTLVKRNYVNAAPEAALLYRPGDRLLLRGRVATG